MKSYPEHGKIPPRDSAIIFNQLINGENNASVNIELTNGTSTVVNSDEYGVEISEFSAVTFMPLSSASSIELYSGNMYIEESNIKNGEFTVSHTASAAVREFRILVMGGSGL